MKKIFGILFAIIATFILIIFSFQSAQTQNDIDEGIALSSLDLSTLIAEPEKLIHFLETGDINDLPLQDNMALYQYSDPSSIVYMYITVRKGNASDNSDHTWEEVNDFTKYFFENNENVEVGKAEIIFQVGDENGPVPGDVGYGDLITNATIQVRGNTASRAPQKSYKIELRDRTGEWQGQSTIVLNKNIYDITRIRNKLMYDLLIDIPDMVSMRTEFVRLFVKDETQNPPNEFFVDYGLFTQIEQPNRKFLRNHQLDGNAQFYKPNFFEFYRYPNLIRLVEDSLYSEFEFSKILEIKGSNDHSKLIQMLDEINNYSLPIEQTFEKYFDADNYFTWMAFNILVGNIDTQAQNYYLYSPQNGIKWYFLPWDYDQSLTLIDRELFNSDQYEFWERGIGNYWGNILHKRILTIRDYRVLLDEKILELKNNYLTKQKIEDLLIIYLPAIEQYILAMPDLKNLPGTLEDFSEVYNKLSLEIELNYQIYENSLDLPMPFFLGTPRIKEDKMNFYWDEAYDFDAQDINYQFDISTDWEFNNVVLSKTTNNLIAIEINLLPPGSYYWRVLATNEDGKVQYPFDAYYDAEGDQHSGMKYFYLSPEGSIIEE